MVENKKSLMTPEDVANYLSISPRTVYDYAQKGKIPAIKIGGQWRFREDDISQWLDNKLSSGSSNLSSIPKSPDQIRKEKYRDAETHILDSIDSSVSIEGKVPIETLLGHVGIEDEIIYDVIKQFDKKKIIEVKKEKKSKINYIIRRK